MSVLAPECLAWVMRSASVSTKPWLARAGTMRDPKPVSTGRGGVLERGGFGFFGGGGARAFESFSHSGSSCSQAFSRLVSELVS